jgi:hypothetical protein
VQASFLFISTAQITEAHTQASLARDFKLHAASRSLRQCAGTGSITPWVSMAYPYSKVALRLSNVKPFNAWMWVITFCIWVRLKLTNTKTKPPCFMFKVATRKAQVLKRIRLD